MMEGTSLSLYSYLDQMPARSYFKFFFNTSGLGISLKAEHRVSSRVFQSYVMLNGSVSYTTFSTSTDFVMTC